jgi:hypothetical protein
MAERAAVFEGLQIGKETTPGTSPATGAKKRLPSLVLAQTIEADATVYKANGGKFAVTSALGMESWQSSVSGPATYNELAYVLCSAVQGVTATEMGTSGVYSWTFAPNQSAPDSMQTYEIQTGSTVRAQQVNFASFTDVGFEFTRKDVKMTGQIIAQRLTDGITMTTAPTTVPLQPIVPNQVTVFLNTTHTTLGTTKLLRVLNCKWSSKGKLGPLWAVNKTDPSWVATVEKAPTTEIEIQVEATSLGMALLSDLRGGTKVFVRISCVGPLVATSDTFLFQIDNCCEVTKAGAFADATGVYAITFTLTVIEATTAFAAAYKMKLQNKLTAL